jgi:hypothetical protein
MKNTSGQFSFHFGRKSFKNTAKNIMEDGKDEQPASYVYEGGGDVNAGSTIMAVTFDRRNTNTESTIHSYSYPHGDLCNDATESFFFFWRTFNDRQRRLTRV